eukprot:TRINITY_DN538_c0_g4_i1.p1 TRINITY_DN538_c0_g4~~TRINITY_DN538_c0_g4_i1.p1  ORF type:complete len:606 (+),score=76.61 TRINITY_DN538_c0_g4_i1:37-1854(+)
MASALFFVYLLPWLSSLWREAQAASVTCSRISARDGQRRCSLVREHVQTALAWGTFHDDVNETGWGRLFIRTKHGNDDAAFAAGYLEGALTVDRVRDHYANLITGNRWSPLPVGVKEYIEATDAWTKAQIAQADPSDEYWSAVRFMYTQLDGLLAGLNSRLASSREFQRLDILLIQLHGDMGDIVPAVNELARINFDKVASKELAMWTQLRSHCSALVKLTPDHQELYVGHNTWIGFHMMIRMVKRYEFGSKRPISMSSFPGILASTDDFYQVGNLVVTETTLPQFTNDIYDDIKPEALPCWLRAMVANQLAKNGSEWMEAFSKHNSGTYNNMWMVVDYSKFTPGELLPDGVLTVGEQLPGYFHYEDQTRVLAYGYWPSYNVALYPETASRIHQDEAVAKHGKYFSYQLASRAQIFLRDHHKVFSDEDMQKLMRQNKFRSDPVAQQDPCRQIACRADLNPNRSDQRLFGAIDAKYSSAAHNRDGRIVVIAGPTHDDQPVFDWAEVLHLAQHSSHVGHPQRFDFDWLLIGTQADATPWLSVLEPNAGKLAPRNSLVFTGLAMPLLIVAVVVVVSLVKYSMQRIRIGSDDMYRPLEASGPKIVPSFF